MELDVSEERRERRPAAHRWWARRGSMTSRAAVLLTHQPELAADESQLANLLDDVEISDRLSGVELLDLCSGAGTVAAAASSMGASVTSVDSHPIAVLIGRAELTYPTLFGEPEPGSRGCGPDRQWMGLSHEFKRWSGAVISDLQRRSGGLWLAELEGIVCAWTTRCPGCSATGPMGVDEGAAFRYRRGTLRCSQCGSEFARRDADVLGIMPVRDARTGTEVDEHLASLLLGSRYPHAYELALDDPWVFTRTGSIPYRRAVTARQAQIVQHAHEALRAVRGEMADRGYAPDRITALTSYMALALSSIVDVLSTAARWNRHRRSVVGLERHEWSETVEFVEVGGDQLVRRLRRRCNEMVEVIERGVGVSADVRVGDMAALDADDDRWDLVVWDPPYYDNIDYDRVALPWTRFLRAAIAEFDASLPWPRDPLPGASPERFDAASYEEAMKAAVGEVARVLRQGGTLGIFWIRSSEEGRDDLQKLLDWFAAKGLSLVETVELKSAMSPALRSHRQPLLLVFESALGQSSDAGAVLAGAASGHRVMVGGLVELLDAHLEEEEIEDLIPGQFRGTRSERLAEAMMRISDPRWPLTRLSKRSLREYVISRGGKEAELSVLDREELATRVLQLLGWRVPMPPGFTIGGALDEADAHAARLRLCETEVTIRGAALAAFSRIEDVLRFSVVTWSVRESGDEWRAVLDDILGRSDGLSFGHWVNAFREVPRRFGSMAPIAHGLKRGKVLSALDDAVGMRNRTAHTENEPNWIALRDEAVVAASGAVRRLRDAEVNGLLPRVLQPVSETRDAFGRLTLRMNDHRGHPVECLLTEAADLSRPVVIVPSGANPREVDPLRLDALEVAARAGVG